MSKLSAYIHRHQILDEVLQPVFHVLGDRFDSLLEKARDYALSLEDGTASGGEKRLRLEQYLVALIKKVVGRDVPLFIVDLLVQLAVSAIKAHKVADEPPAPDNNDPYYKQTDEIPNGLKTGDVIYYNESLRKYLVQPHGFGAMLPEGYVKYEVVP